MGTAGPFVYMGPNACGGGVDGPNDTLHDEAVLLVLPKESWILPGKLSDNERMGVPVKVYIVLSDGRYPPSSTYPTVGDDDENGVLLNSVC